MTLSKKQVKELITEEFSAKRLFAVFIVCVATIGLFNAFRFGVANVDYSFVKNSIEAWQQKGLTQDPSKYTAAKQAIENAGVLHSSHPMYKDLTAQINEWGVVSGFDTDLSLQQAKKNYLLASRSRPLWPLTWGNLAMVKWRMLEFDEEMLRFLNQADSLGPQTPEIHILFSQLGLVLYQESHPFYTELSDTIHKRLQKGLGPHSHRARPIILDYIHANGHKEAVCGWMKPLDETIYIDTLKCDVTE
jgi:hypothetical protein